MAKENVPRTIMNKDNKTDDRTDNRTDDKTDNVNNDKQYKKCSKEEEDKIRNNIKNHNKEEFLKSKVYEHLVGEKPRRFLQDLFGAYYTMLHSFFVVAIGYLICFVNDMSYLVIGLLIISLDGYANVVLHDCPLSMVENKYLDKSGIENRLEFLRSLGIMYSANNKYDIQLEVIINAWTLIAGKIIMLICFRNFTRRNFL